MLSEPICTLNQTHLQALNTYQNERLWPLNREDVNVHKAQILAVCTKLCGAVHRNLEKERARYLEELIHICQKINSSVTVKEFLQQAGIDQLFPRLMHFLDKAPGAPKVDMGTTVAGYIVLLSCYNQVYELAALLQTDVTTLNDHKYIAHQMVLLHQSVSKCGKALEAFKAEIEMHFEDLKQEIEGFEEATLMSAGMQEWFCDFLERLAVHAASCAAAALARLPCGKDLSTFLSCDLNRMWR